MYRSYYAVWDAGNGRARRFDDADFAAVFGWYQKMQSAGPCQLYGVDRLDRSVLLGEIIN